MKNAIICLVAALSFMSSGCGPMDERYSELIEDGPILYISKPDDKSIQVSPGRNRLKISWPKSNDPRGKYAVVSWANNTKSTKVDINQTGMTEVVIDNLTEGSYIFDITLFDLLGNTSLPVSKVGTVYGEDYERYLINWSLNGFTLSSGYAVLTFAEPKDNTIAGSKITWSSNGSGKKLFAGSDLKTVTIEDFNSLSFACNTVYLPETTAIDSFYSPAKVYVKNTNIEEVRKETNPITVIFPEIFDDHYAGVEITWTQDGTDFTSTLSAGSTTATLENFNAPTFRYRTFFDYDDIRYYSDYNVYEVLTPVDLDRTGWVITASHKLPTDPSNNSTQNLIDGNNATFLSLIKPGKSYGGVTVGASETVFFIIDMGSIQEFEYFRLLHRDISPLSSATPLRAQKYSFYGSNDGNNFEAIQIGVTIDVNQLEITQDLPKSAFRYLKVTYDQWNTATSSAMQIAEFNLGIRK
ncbi:MAG: DUF4998 domain-containing protein [Mangrovibacterium sp.]